MLTITGLALVPEGKKKDNLAMLHDFFDTKLQLRVKIEDYFVLGNPNYKPQIVIILQSMEFKCNIMQQKKILKHSPEYAKVFINEYFPSTTYDKQKRESDIVQELKNDGRADQVSYGKGGLCISNRPYRRKIVPPTPAELVNVEPEQLDHILNLKSTRGEIIKQDRSEFTGYAARVSNHDDIKEHYIRMKMIQPSARHIACAYWIQHQEPCYSRDYHDDGEPGAGRALLQLLKENMNKNTVIFVARKYGGIKMGSIRFQCYTDAARSALGITSSPVSRPQRSSTTNNQKPTHSVKSNSSGGNNMKAPAPRFPPPMASHSSSNSGITHRKEMSTHLDNIS